MYMYDVISGADPGFQKRVGGGGGGGGELLMNKEGEVAGWGTPPTQLGGLGVRCKLHQRRAPDSNAFLIISCVQKRKLYIFFMNQIIQ